MQPKYNLFSEVVLLHDIPTLNLKRGSKGIVVEYYSMNEPTQNGYSLEGFNVPNITVEVAESEITSIEQWQKEMEILEKLHQLSIPKLVHLDEYIERLINSENENELKVS